ncbi:type II CAAX prenyl endopeptidase Rce1 family protein [Streptococcus sp. UBA4344]|uniref:CPBP family glutamic-type intramembrane protease n=1 Tax=Streptococcus sp. UBA4344 TaxID=1947564 RepID=UPI00257AA013|nr:CPBP family glutamic-type intramembrane protease [Streptococcus sp. UBA4344]
MKKENMKLNRVWLSFLIYLLFFWLGSLILNQKQLVWLLLEFYVLVIDSFILWKYYRYLQPKHLIISGGLCGLYILSELIHLTPLSIFNIVLVFLSACAVMGVFAQKTKGALKWFKGNSGQSVATSIGIGIFVGLIWGAINCLLMLGSNPLQPSSVFKAFLLSLSPAIIEEIAYRTVFYAFCLSMVSGQKLQSKGQELTAYVMMTIPHILPHTVECFKNGFLSGLLEWLISVVLYLLIFGLVFAFLQRKRDIASAMIAHGTVDFMRFCLFGLPI